MSTEKRFSVEEIHERDGKRYFQEHGLKAVLEVLRVIQMDHIFWDRRGQNPGNFCLRPLTLSRQMMVEQAIETLEDEIATKNLDKIT